MKNKFKNKYYFAHSMQIYNTKLEKELTETIKSFNFPMICPNKDIGELGSLNPYLQIVKKCKGVITHEFKGYVGKGAFEETKLSLQLDKPTFVIRDGKIIPVKTIKINNSKDWKITYGVILT